MHAPTKVGSALKQPHHMIERHSSHEWHLGAGCIHATAKSLSCSRRVKPLFLELD